MKTCQNTPAQTQRLRKNAGWGQFHEPCCWHYSGSPIQIEWRKLWHPPLSACRSAVSNPEVTTHQEGIIPRTAGSASSLGFRSTKLIRQLNSNNDPPLNTPREDMMRSLYKKNPGALADNAYGDLTTVSSTRWTAVKNLTLAVKLGCGHCSDNSLNIDLEWKEFGWWGSDRPGFELFVCHFSIACCGTILKPLSPVFLFAKWS